MFDLKFISEMLYLIRAYENKTSKPIKFVTIYTNSQRKELIEMVYSTYNKDINEDFKVWVFNRYLNANITSNALLYKG